MAEQRQCIRCNRAIDAHARICPYCNWDQTDASVPPPVQQASSTADYVPPQETAWKRYLLMGIGGAVLLIASFALGSLIHGHNPPKDVKSPTDTAATAAKAPTKPGPASDVTLVPISDTAGIEQPITSAPIPNQTQGVPTEYQRSDATAVSSVEYAQLAARANAEKQASAPAVDPRSLGGPAYAQGQPPRQPRPAVEPQTAAAEKPSEQATPREEATRTAPQPISQPTPNISVDQTTSVRLDLIVGADGRVKEVNIHGGVPGQTAKIIGAVQQWTFKPATLNGTPVEAPFSVELSFRGNE